MRKAIVAAIILVASVGLAQADSFGTGVNQFTIDFVTISGDSGNLGSWPAGTGYTFTGANRSAYRMGTFEISNDQWTKFEAELGVPVTGTPPTAYDESPDFTGAKVPTNNVSWYEATQFVNWLNTSTGHHAAYNFTGTQGTSGYTFDVWSPAEADGGTNLYRHKDAFYFLPTEDEWVKAAYWNGTTLQTYATKAGDALHQGDGVSGTGWNYRVGDDWGPAGPAEGPWDVGRASEELNGTFDIMGNVWEWVESPYSDMSYGTDSYRGLRGGAYYRYDHDLASTSRDYVTPRFEFFGAGFRVASVPEPGCAALLLLCGGALLRRQRRSG